MKEYSKFSYDLLVVIFRSLWNSDLPMEKIVGGAFREAVSPNKPADCRMTFRFVGDLEKIVIYRWKKSSGEHSEKLCHQTNRRTAE